MKKIIFIFTGVIIFTVYLTPSVFADSVHGYGISITPSIVTSFTDATVNFSCQNGDSCSGQSPTYYAIFDGSGNFVRSGNFNSLPSPTDLATFTGISSLPNGDYSILITSYNGGDWDSVCTTFSACDANGWNGDTTFTVSIQSPPPSNNSGTVSATIQANDISFPTSTTKDLLGSVSEVVKDPGMLALFVVGIGIPLAFIILQEAKHLIIRRKQSERLRDLADRFDKIT